MGNNFGPPPLVGAGADGAADENETSEPTAAAGAIDPGLNVTNISSIISPAGTSTAAATTVPNDNTSSLRALSTINDIKALVAVNALPASASSNVPGVPAFATMIDTAYTNGVASQITLYSIGGVRLEQYTAIDFYLMRSAAQKDGIALTLSQGFRTNAQQEFFYKERSDPRVRQTKGQAAKPGYSNHQSGIACDIHVGMDPGDIARGNITPIYLWLLANAARYGFDQREVTVSGHVTEPWHWTHLNKEIYGTAQPVQLYSSVDHADVAAASAIDTGQGGALAGLGSYLYDKAQSVARSAQLTYHTRNDHLNSGAANSILSSGGASGTAANVSGAQASASQPLPQMDQTTVSPFVYDFVNGVWGDGSPT